MGVGPVSGNNNPQPTSDPKGTDSQPSSGTSQAQQSSQTGDPTQKSTQQKSDPQVQLFQGDTFEPTRAAPLVNLSGSTSNGASQPTTSGNTDALAAASGTGAGPEASKASGALAAATGAVGTPVKPTDFKDGGVYRQTYDANTKQYTYTQVQPNQVPKGAIVFVNGIETTGPDEAKEGQATSRNNNNRDVYLVYNSSGFTKEGNVDHYNAATRIAGVNHDPNGSDERSVQSVRQILNSTGGNATLMGHSMGHAIITAAAQQYHDKDKGDLHGTYIYGWGGVAYSGNTDRIVGYGAHSTDFVHENIQKRDGKTQRGQDKWNTAQDGDALAGHISQPQGGNNWVTKKVDEQGKVLTVERNNSHTVGIDYEGIDNDPQDDYNDGPGHGHEYGFQLGDTRGGYVTSDGSDGSTPSMPNPNGQPPTRVN